MFKSITYLLRPKPTVVEKVVVKKDPNGLIRSDLATLRRYAATGEYKVGDCIESVAYRQGQLDLIRMIETKMVAKPHSL